MTPHDLLTNFETLAEAPNGIQRLRELVLDLAMRGKLVEQDPAEEAASRLLKRAKSERARLEESGEARRGRDLPPPESVDQAFPAPPGWVWTRLGSLLLSDLGGGTPSKQVSRYWDGPIPWASVKDIGKRKFIDDTVDHISEEGLSDSASNLIQPQALLVCVRMGLGKVSINTVPMAINQDVRALCPSSAVLIDYLYNYLKITSLEGSGMTVKGIKREELLGMSICLPPVEEQRRIVARVDELMALLDRLEAKRQDREAARTAARDSALAALREAPTPDDVETAWLRIQQRFGELFATPEDVAPLRQALLQLAVQGKLLPQSPEDPSGASLLEEIEQAKSKAVHAGRRRSGGTKNETPLIESSNMLPLGWARARLGDILWECRNGLSKTPNDAGEGFKLLRISAATGNPKWLVNCLDHRWVNVSAEEAEQYRVHTGDLLSCRFNGNLHFVGKVAQVTEIGQEIYLYPDKLIRLRPIRVNPRFLCLAINAGPSRIQIESFAATTAGNIGINGTQLQSIVVPIPPLPEQARIVARVDDLMTLLDRLTESVVRYREVVGTFAAAAVHHLDV